MITEAAPATWASSAGAGFNVSSPRSCAAHGALFVSDEVMTGFRVTRSGQWGLDGAVEGWQPDLVTFGKVMGGGFPAAAFGGRADVMAMLSPEGRSTRQARCRGTRSRPRRASPRCAWPPTTSTPTSTRRPCCSRRASAALRPGGRPAPRAEHREHVQRLLRRGGRDVGAELRGRRHAARGPVQGVLPRDARAGRLPPAERLRVVVPLRATTRALDKIISALPAAARAAAAVPTPRSLMKTVVHLLRHGGVWPLRRPLRPPVGYHLSDLGKQMAQRVADTVGDRDITHVVSSPLEQAQETAAPSAVARRRPRHRLARDRVPTSSRARPSAWGTACSASRAPGATCGTFRPSWASPARRSPRG